MFICNITKEKALISFLFLLINYVFMQSFFRKHAPNDKGPYGISSEVMDTYVKSCGELQFAYLALLIIYFFINHYLRVLNHDILFSGLLCHHLHPRGWRPTSRQFTSHKDW